MNPQPRRLSDCLDPQPTHTDASRHGLSASIYADTEPSTAGQWLLIAVSALVLLLALAGAYREAGEMEGEALPQMNQEGYEK